MSIVRSISGLRATLGDSLTPELVINYISALHSVLPDGTVIVGRDGRPSGEWIEELIIGTFQTCRRDSVCIGIVPTPTVQLMVEHSDAVAGIAITASHNPDNWNGLKFINSEGVFFNKEENEKLWNTLDSHNFKFPDKFIEAKSKNIENAIDSHIEKLLTLSIFQNTDILTRIKDLKLKVVVDAVNASGSVAVPELLEKLGCNVIKLFCDGSGIFPHTPEPLPENLTLLAEAVKTHKTDIGIAVDPDADRLVLIDENGNPIGEEKTICLAIDSILHLKSYMGNDFEPVAVVNLSTTRLADDIARIRGCSVLRSAVGEINVVNKMKKCNAIIGGEGSGGVILPACHYGRDSLVGIALILALLAIKKKKLSEICLEYPKYEMLKFKQTFSGDFDSLIQNLQNVFKDAVINIVDGFRADYPDKWVQIRKSNTELIIRIISEAKTKEEANELLEIVKKNI